MIYTFLIRKKNNIKYLDANLSLPLNVVIDSFGLHEFFIIVIIFVVTKRKSFIEGLTYFVFVQSTSLEELDQ